VRKLLESDSLIQINLIASYLQSNGVTTKILNEHQSSIRSVVSFNRPVHPELWVHPEEFEIAAKLVGRYQHDQESNDSSCEIEWLCKKMQGKQPWQLHVMLELRWVKLKHPTFYCLSTWLHAPN
jgi:hypothetical protein